MIITTQDIIFRLLTAMLIGLIVGVERQRTHHPAGIRTHTLVALGACVVMLTGTVMWQDYTALGATPDPARLAAQVIPGVGFLGAGTIMRENFSIKGLTTAANLWATACMGLCAGAGFYATALTCAIAVVITLSIFELLQQRVLGAKGSVISVQMVCASAIDAVEALQALAKSHSALLENLEYDRKEGLFHISFKVRFTGSHQRETRQDFLRLLGPSTDAIRIDSLIEAL